MREKQQSLHSVLQILGCCHWILNNTIELFKKINKIGWKFDPLRFSMAFHFLIFFLKLNLLIQVVNKLFSTPSSTLGKLHVFGCACLKHKCTVIPTFWESPYLFNLKDCTFQTLDTSLKGLRLFSSVEQVEVIVSNLMFGPWLCCLSTLHHILGQWMFEGIYWFECGRFPKSTVFASVLFKAIVSNLKFGPCLCYWSKMHHILAQYRFEGIFWFVWGRFSKKYWKVFLVLYIGISSTKL